MDITELTYPVFVADQVLTEAHLNDLFEYLDEQNRLTRADLIGIGIVCGLEVAFEAPGTVHLSRGCGITSQGYLAVEPDDLALTHASPYTLPDPYRPFLKPRTNPAEQYPLWELFPDDDEPGAVPLTDPRFTLDRMAVVLFLELRTNDLRTCGPNSCDDRGARVTTTLRRLLTDVADLDAIIAASPAVPGADVPARLQLPDLRMPRIDVPNSTPVTAEDVLRAFQEPFRQHRLVQRTAAALTELYRAFHPLVADDVPNDPFTSFVNRFGFLDALPVTPDQVLHLPSYWDLFDDLLAAYDELRWKGVDLVCACCPAEDLFPRHLMAGVLDPVAHDPATHRHHFLPSPAVGDCADRSRDVRTLFRRLVEMLASFTEQPPDRGVRATPSRWGDVPVSAKAIPRHYDHDSTPPLFELWDPEKTRRRRAHHNLGYRADEFRPAPPDFVTDPLRFDLEPTGFLRIEGHVGKDVRGVLRTLLALRTNHRLPIDVIAVRTGAFNEDVEIELGADDCRFQDLETLYETLRAELICFLVKQVQYFYDIPVTPQDGEEEIAPELELLRTHAPDFVARPATLGRWIELIMAQTPDGRSRPIFPNPGPFPGLNRTPAILFVHGVVALVRTMSDLASSLTDDLRAIDLAEVEQQHHRLVETARQLENIRRDHAEVDRPGLSDRLDDIVFRCRFDPIEALHQEHRRRLRDAKQLQFFGHFLDRHPGIAHKAGVPLGGTFIVVYHDVPRAGGDLRPRPFPIRPPAGPGREPLVPDALAEALGRLQFKKAVADDPDVRLLFAELTGRQLVPRLRAADAAERVYTDAVAALADGTVIADFFLPYLCCSDCPPIQYQLPASRLQVSARAHCTQRDGTAPVTVTVAGAVGTASVQVDGGAFEELAGALLLSVGQHTIVARDAAGNESAPLPFTVVPQLVIVEPEVIDDGAGNFHVEFTIAGGAPPYTADVGTVVGTAYASPAVPVDQRLAVVVRDAARCSTSGSFQTVDSPPCDLPCAGEAVRQGHRFWLPEARRNAPINDLKVEVRRFEIVDPGRSGSIVLDHTALSTALTTVGTGATPTRGSINATDYVAQVGRWLDVLNATVVGAVGSDQWLRFEYTPEPEPGTTGTLHIDRLECLDFTFELVVTFVQRRRPHEISTVYHPRGTAASDQTDGSKIHVPPFEVTRSNKCWPNEPAVPACTGTDLKPAIGRTGKAPDPVTLTATWDGDDTPSDFLWEIEDGRPSVDSGRRVTVLFDPIRPVERFVRLTVFTDNGCKATFEETIDITQDGG